MKKEEMEKILKLRATLVFQFSRLRDYKSNKNAIMLEKEHAKVLHETIVSLDSILKN